MRYKLQNYFKVVAFVLLIACPLVVQSAEQNQARKEFDLSGWWKADKIRPGQGVKEQYHKLPLWHHTTEDWMNAKIPGDIYTDLWRAGAIDEPYYGRNIEKTKWAIELEWWYTKLFKAPQELQDKNLKLLFEGVDYECQVWLNEEYLGSHAGTFSKFAFDITGKLHFPGLNRLTVKIDPPPRNRTLIGGRKGASVDYGGDYMQTFIMVGIWRPVKIHVTEGASIEEVYVEPEVKPDGSALLNIEVELENQTKAERKVTVNAEVEGKNFTSKMYKKSLDIKLKPGLKKFNMKMDIDEAKLWWPWDMGEQNLYKLTLSVNDDGKTLDYSETSFGIKDLKMEMNPGFTKDEVEYPWTFMINGKRHYLRGGCWSGPPDLMPGRRTLKKYKELIKLAKKANINHFRIFGWHPPEIPEFYDLCDEAGITVWQEFSLCNTLYPDDAEFRKAAAKESIAIVKERRNHPCLVMWCGGEELRPSEANKKLIFAIGEAIRPYTNIPYVPMSAMSTHGWGPAMGFKPKEDCHACEHWYSNAAQTMEEYYSSLDFAIVTEICEASAPNVESIKEFIPPDELWPPGPSWGYHFAELDIFRNINVEVFGDERMGSLEEFVSATQIAEGMGMKYCIETFRRKKPHNSGCVFCHFIDPWPDFKWALVDYYVRPKKSYYFIQTAFQPVLVNLEYHKRRWLNGEDFEASLWVVNDYHKSFKNSTIELRITDKQGKLLKEDSVKEADIKADSSKKFKDIRWKVPENLKEGFDLELTLKDSEGVRISGNDYSFLIGDEELLRERLKRRAKIVGEHRRKHGQRLNHYRMFPSLGAEEIKW